MLISTKSGGCCLCEDSPDTRLQVQDKAENPESEDPFRDRFRSGYLRNESHNCYCCINSHGVFICDLFDCTVSSSDWIASDVRIINE
jgi:hypothetical protein